MLKWLNNQFYTFEKWTERKLYRFSIVYKEGRHAYRHGWDFHQNPYPTWIIKHDQWAAGWKAERNKRPIRF